MVSSEWRIGADLLYGDYMEKGKKNATPHSPFAIRYSLFAIRFPAEWLRTRPQTSPSLKRPYSCCSVSNGSYRIP